MFNKDVNRQKKNLFHIMPSRAHQTHYEQFGETAGTVHIEGHEPISIRVQGIRDHSYGKTPKHHHTTVVSESLLNSASLLCSFSLVVRRAI